MEETIEKIKQEENFIYKAKLLKGLLDSSGLKKKEMAQKLDIKPSYVSHILRLNRLPEMVIDGYYSDLITVSHLFIISRLKDKKQMADTYEKVLIKNLTVKETEEEVREILYQIKSKGNYLKEKEELIKKFKEKFSRVDIKIIQTRVKGKIVIEVKGNLGKTTKTIKELIKKLTD